MLRIPFGRHGAVGDGIRLAATQYAYSPRERGREFWKPWSAMTIPSILEPTYV
jgi:hypothetical protein